MSDESEAIEADQLGKTVVKQKEALLLFEDGEQQRDEKIDKIGEMGKHEESLKTKKSHGRLLPLQILNTW